MKYIRKNRNKWQCRIYNEGIRYSFTDANVEIVKQKRNEILGYDPDGKPQEIVLVERHESVIEVGETHYFGALGDTHLCSRYERLDVLHTLYDIYAEKGIKQVFLTGNYIDGEKSFNTQDIHVRGLDNQVDYFVNHYPQRDGVTTYFISGDDHEGWYTQREGVDIGKRTEQSAKDIGRKDLVYLGHVERDVLFNVGDVHARIRLVHPGGGSAQSISLAGQRIVDGYSNSEKPHILLVGHYHKSHFLPYYKGVHIIQTGSCVEQNIFLRKQNIASHLGGWIVGVSDFNDNFSVSAQYFPFEPRIWRSKNHDPFFIR